MTLHWKTRGRLFGLAWLAVSFVNANAGYSLPDHLAAQRASFDANIARIQPEAETLAQLDFKALSDNSRF